MLRKLLVHKKKILLLKGIVFVALVSFSLAVINMSTGKKNDSISSSSSLSKLSQLQSEKVKKPENKLQVNDYSANSLPQVLKKEDNKSANEDWKKVFKSSSFPTKLEVKTSKVTVQGNKTPANQSPGNKLPQPCPPINQWEKKLAEFRNIYDTEIYPLIDQIIESGEKIKENSDYWQDDRRQKDLSELWKFMKEDQQNSFQKLVQKLSQKLANFLYQYQNLEPLEGIDLAGVEKQKLQKLPHFSVPRLASSNRSEIKDYKNWVKLRASGDGNCFLNSFCILLTGQENKDLIIRLRLAIFYETIDSFYKYTQGKAYSLLGEYIDVYYDFQLRRIYTNYSAMASDVALRQLAKILKRNLLIVNLCSTGDVITKANPPSGLLSYPENWVLVGNDIHVDPLIPAE